MSRGVGSLKLFQATKISKLDTVWCRHPGRFLIITSNAEYLSQAFDGALYQAIVDDEYYVQLE